MSLADCNKCLRRHIRPVGIRCEYYNFAVNKRTELIAAIEDYALNLPGIGELELGVSTFMAEGPDSITSP